MVQAGSMCACVCMHVLSLSTSQELSVLMRSWALLPRGLEWWGEMERPSSVNKTCPCCGHLGSERSGFWPGNCRRLEGGLS